MPRRCCGRCGGPTPSAPDAIDWHGLAARLGADVPVCLAGVPALIRGIGDRIEPLAARTSCRRSPRPRQSARAPVDGARVPRAGRVFSLSASSRGEGAGAPPGPFPDLQALLAYMRARGNDLEPPAISLLPVIADVKAALAARARMPSRGHVRQRPDLLRHFRRRRGGGKRGCRACARAPGLVDRPDPARRLSEIAPSPQRRQCRPQPRFGITQKRWPNRHHLARACAGRSLRRRAPAPSAATARAPHPTASSSSNLACARITTAGAASPQSTQCLAFKRSLEHEVGVVVAAVLRAAHPSNDPRTCRPLKPACSRAHDRSPCVPRQRPGRQGRCRVAEASPRSRKSPRRCRPPAL